MHDRGVAPLGQDLLVRELFGERFDRLLAFTRGVVVDKAGRVLGGDTRDQRAAQRVDQAWLVGGAGVYAHPRAHVARRDRRVRCGPTHCDPLFVQPIDGDMAKNEIVDASGVGRLGH